LERVGRDAPPLVVLRSEAESGRVGLRLVGELDLNTVELLEAALARTRDQAPPSVIDLGELRFLDLIGLRALLRAVEGYAPATVRLIRATGIVRRLIELAHALDDAPAATARAPLPVERTTTTIAAGIDDRTGERARGSGTARRAASGSEERA
jgi:anti-anti-sigma factor